MSFLRQLFPLLMFAAIACGPGEDNTLEWWEDGDDTDSIGDTDKGDDTGDGKGDGKDTGDGKGDGKDTGEYPDCGGDFDPTATCEGDWKETICTHNGKTYWCQDGVWLNEDDKD
jgi:hypothetical protein